MFQSVVQNGTGRAAQLDFTYAVGKTGTSSSWRDAWFMGFTGQYVVGVWIGNDDFSPMARVTGGSFPAQTWHNFMVAAHDTDNISQIPGIELHPVQVAEQERIAAAQKAAETGAPAENIPRPTPESVKDMSPATRTVLEKIGTLLKEARPLLPSDAATAKRAEMSGAGGKVPPSLASATVGNETASSQQPPRAAAQSGQATTAPPQ
jgi:penicillin-binding protein 1A